MKRHKERNAGKSEVHYRGWRLARACAATVSVLMRAACGLVVIAPALATDVFLMGEHVGYGVTLFHGQSCFAVAPQWVAPGKSKLFAMRPGASRQPAVVKHTFADGFSIVRIGGDTSACKDSDWSDGAQLETALGRTGIGSLKIGVNDGAAGLMHVWIEQIEPAGFFTISPVRESDRLMAGMAGSRVLLEARDAGILLEVDEANNRGRVIRQDYLNGLIAPVLASLVYEIDAEPEPEAVVAAVPEIKHSFFVGKQSWRNNPKIVGTRIFVGSSGLKRHESDVLDGVYSFDFETGEKIWFSPTQLDFNDLTYIKGLVIGGTESGQVVAIGARSGKTYWTRQFDSAVLARPVGVRGAVAIATSAGQLNVLDLKDGSTKSSSDLNGGVSAGLAADRAGLWVATDTGTLYRYAGFGEVQMRRDSSVYYPDELGHSLSGSAIDWYEQLGNGRGLRARFDAAPLVLDNSIVLSLVREDNYDYPPVILFNKDGALGWVGTDPNQFVKGAFGDSHQTPVAWYDRLILADASSNAIYSILRETGEIVWATDLGNANFQLWSSPVVSNDHVFIATYDGFLHKFAAHDGKRVWSMYLGEHEIAGRTFFGDQPLPDPTRDPDWPAETASPIVSTPAVSGDTIVVGTERGYVYVIKDKK